MSDVHSITKQLKAEVLSKGSDSDAVNTAGYDNEVDDIDMDTFTAEGVSPIPPVSAIEVKTQAATPLRQDTPPPPRHMISIRIDGNYNGVTLIEMESLLDQSDCIIEVKWGNSQVEVDLLRQCQDRDVVLVVADAAAMERTASTLGLPYLIESTMAQKAMDALRLPEGRWREFARETGPNLARATLMRSCAQSIRAGRDYEPLRKVLVESLFDGTSPFDADVLLGLRRSGAKP